MVYEDAKVGLSKILFPVREVPVLAELVDGEAPAPIPGKKAIVHGLTYRVFSVVSSRYIVLKNRDALKLARRCCVKAFPTTQDKDWKVFSIEAAETGGHCRVDLCHARRALDFDWSFAGIAQDTYHPFLRVTNSYNRRHVFSLRFGFVRSACRNGLVDWRSSIEVGFSHDTRNLEQRVDREIDEATYRKVKKRFWEFLECLAKQDIPHDRFRSIIHSVLKIDKPNRMKEERARAWRFLERIIDGVADRYVGELGTNGYALWNAITDIATNPPTKTLGHRFILRERHVLQRLAGTWAAAFTWAITEKQDFDVSEYIADPSPERLRRRIQRKHGRPSLDFSQQ